MDTWTIQTWRSRASGLYGAVATNTRTGQVREFAPAFDTRDAARYAARKAIKKPILTECYKS